MKPAHLRPQAEADLVEAARHDAEEGSIELAERMFDGALDALEPIGRMLAMGSPRLGQLAEIPCLRSWRVTGSQSNGCFSRRTSTWMSSAWSGMDRTSSAS